MSEEKKELNLFQKIATLKLILMVLLKMQKLQLLICKWLSSIAQN